MAISKAGHGLDENAFTTLFKSLVQPPLEFEELHLRQFNKNNFLKM